MKLKKPIFVLALLLLLGCLVLSPLSAFAVNVDVSGGSYEGNTQTITGNDGPIFTIGLQTDPSLAGGTYDSFLRSA